MRHSDSSKNGNIPGEQDFIKGKLCQGTFWIIKYDPNDELHKTLMESKDFGVFIFKEELYALQEKAFDFAHDPNREDRVFYVVHPVDSNKEPIEDVIVYKTDKFSTKKKVNCLRACVENGGIGYSWGRGRYLEKEKITEEGMLWCDKFWVRGIAGEELEEWLQAKFPDKN